jgi:hypothetical protein
MEIAGRQLIKGRQRLAVAVERALTGKAATLVNNGHETRPLRRGVACAAYLGPAAKTVGPVNCHA